MLRRPVHLTIADPWVDRVGTESGLDRSSLFLIIAFVIMLAFLVYYAQYSGSVRWLLGLGGLSAFALFAWALIFRRTAEPMPLLASPVEEGVRDGELASVSAAMRRASRGLSYSQGLVVSRARAAFLERVRLARGIPPEEMAKLQRSPAGLHRIFDDADLERFLRDDPGDFEGRDRWILEARKRGGFGAAFHEVLARMEAWR